MVSIMVGDGMVNGDHGIIVGVGVVGTIGDTVRMDTHIMVMVTTMPIIHTIITTSDIDTVHKILQMDMVCVK
jgi:hypothetical protein